MRWRSPARPCPSSDWVGRLQVSLHVPDKNCYVVCWSARQPVTGMELALDLAQDATQLVANRLALLIGGFIGLKWP